jgi:hypothetical protein
MKDSQRDAVLKLLSSRENQVSEDGLLPPRTGGGKSDQQIKRNSPILAIRSINRHQAGLR